MNDVAVYFEAGVDEGASPAGYRVIPGSIERWKGFIESNESK